VQCVTQMANVYTDIHHISLKTPKHQIFISQLITQEESIARYNIPEQIFAICIVMFALMLINLTTAADTVQTF